MNNIQLHSTPVLLLTGYLGSGKTTLLNHILNNKRNIRFAVMVNDIGEVNIDASLIEKGGIVGQGDDSLVALQNGCICCTLKMDLVKQLNEIMSMGRFDYIVIEASGICEPEPIARTICSIPRMGEEYTRHGVPRLDCIVTVVDALRMQSEFDCGGQLLGSAIAEEDIENLIIQQIEFCNIVLLNKKSEVKPEELERLRQIVLNLNPGVRIIEADYADVDLDEIVNTGCFNYNETSGSAGWVRELERLQRMKKPRFTMERKRNMAIIITTMRRNMSITTTMTTRRRSIIITSTIIMPTAARWRNMALGHLYTIDASPSILTNSITL